MSTTGKTPIFSTLLGRCTCVCAASIALFMQGVNPAVASLDGNTASHTAVSGYAGSASDAFHVSLGDRGITQIAWEELSDRGCFISVTGKDPDNASDTSSSVNGDHCHGISRVDSRKTVKFKDNPRYFVRGIAVCTNNKSNHRLKGIKIVAAKLPTGNDDVQTLTVTNKKDRTNCKNWHQTVYCPSNKVASGLNVKVKDSAFVGIGLQCKARD